MPQKQRLRHRYFICAFCEIFTNNIFTEHLRATDSSFTKKEVLIVLVIYKICFVVKSPLIHLLELRMIYSLTTQNNIQYQIISLFLYSG